MYQENINLLKCINMVDPLIRRCFGSFLSEDQLRSIFKACSDHKKEFESMSIPFGTSIDKLCDELKQLQHE